MRKFINTLVILAFVSIVSSVNAQWVPGNIGTSYNLSGVCIPENNSSYVWVVGYDTSTYQPSLFKSTNSGANWTTLNTFPNYFGYPSSIAFVDANTGLVSGWGGLIATYNGGLNWTNLYTSTDTILFWNFGIGPSGSAWAIGNKSTGGPLGPPVVIRSALGVGSFNFIRLTLPASWTYQLTSLCVKDSNNCVVSTNTHNPSIMLKTTNGGVSWSEISFSPSLDREVWALVGDDVNNDIIGVGGVNDGSTIFRSYDFGSTWSMIYDNLSSGRLKSIGSPFGYIRDTMYAVGESGTILRTINGGTTWYTQNSGVTRDLESVSMGYHLSKFAVAVGDHGTITINGGSIGIQPISTEIPSKYSLSQNYPNPFNPTTNIRFDLPKSGSVKLVVFDALGREVATLVNEKLAPGTYEVDWDGSSYASGVYFYKLMTGEYVDVKKMLLLK